MNATPLRQRHFIDSHKGATFAAVLVMMGLHDQWHSPTAWTYLGLHGSYGLLWVVKSRIFPDRAWERPTGIGFGLVIWAGLSLYWLAPWLLTSRGHEATPWLFGLAVAGYGVGVFLHFTSDMQKWVHLRLQPGILIQNGLLARIRNINYLGELLIYLSFALLAGHWLPYLVLASFLAIVWLPNMRRKERSLARHPQFEAYRRRSAFFLPFPVRAGTRRDTSTGEAAGPENPW